MSDALRFAPKPENWEAMCEAYKDPNAWAREVFKYDVQLQAAGFPTTGEDKRRYGGGR